MSLQQFHTCYDYSTEDGSAVGHGWFRDYIPTQGTLCWDSSGEHTVTVETLNDVRCEHDESVKVILSNYRYYTRQGWEKFCGSGYDHPCQVTATGSIRQGTHDCQAQQFGE